MAYYRERHAMRIRQSMSRKEDPCDNAAAESSFSCLKCELVHHKRCATGAVAQTDIFAYVEAFYNAIRPHFALRWLSPKTFEQRFFSPSRTAA